MSIASRIEQIEQHIENAYESIGNKGVDLRDKLNIDLKGNTSQEVIQGEVGLEVENTSIYVDNVNESKEDYIILKGNTYQDSTTGKNLLNKNLIENGKVTNNYGSPGSTPSPSVTGDRATLTPANAIKVNPSTTYTFNYTDSNFCFALAQMTSNKVSLGDTGWKAQSTTPFSITTNANCEYIGFNFRKGNATAITDSEFNTFINSNVQLEQNNQATSYEPYTNGASPNPDYPQDIEVVTGENVINVCGKNLFDKDNANQINHWFVSQNKIVLSNNVTSFYIKCKPNTQYTVSKVASTRLQFWCTVEKPNVGVSASDSLNLDYNFTGTVKTITTTNDANYLLVYYYLSTSDTKTEEEIRNSIQIEEGSTATTYQEYVGNTYEINLGKNLFDKTQAFTYKWLDANNGKITDSSDPNVVFPFIKTEIGKTYTISGIFDLQFNLMTYTSNDENTWVRRQIANSRTARSFVAETEWCRISIGGGNAISVIDNMQLEKGSEATSYTPYFTPIELCKIGTYQDRIYKSNGNWYLHKEIGKYVCNSTRTNAVNDYMSGTNEVSKNGTYSLFLNDTSSNISNNTMYFSVAKYEYNSIITGNIDAQNNLSDNSFCMRQGTNDRIYFKNSVFTGKTGEEISPLLNGKTLFYVLQTPTDTQITDTTLINQLNALYTATIHSTTHINTETSNLLPYINLKYNVVTPAPSPDRASEVEVVKGNNAIKIQSKNLFDYNNAISSSYYQTAPTKKNNGFVGGSGYYITLPNELPSGTYTLSFNVVNIDNGNNANLQIQDNTDTNIAGAGLNIHTAGIKTSTFTTNNPIKRLKIDQGVQATTTYIYNIQIERNSTASSYVPYQSQSYNITLGNLELCKIGDYQDTIIKSTGKNLFDKDKTPDNYYYNANGTTTIDNVNKFINQEIPFSKTYTVSFANAIINTPGNNPNVRLIEFNDNNFIKRTLITTKTSVTLDNSTNKVIISVDAGPNAYFADLQIEKGTQATEYEPFGKVWYKRTMIGKVVLDGSEEFTSYPYDNSIAMHKDNSLLYITGQSSYCDKFSLELSSISNMTNGEYRISIVSNNTCILFKSEETSNISAFKNWLSTHNTTVYHILAIPTATQITDTVLINQLDALADARKYKDGIETIINQTNSGLSFEIETNPTHLNRNIENISTEIDKIETTEWKPQPDWWDIKTIIKDDEENYPYKIIALQDEGAKTLNIEIDSLFAAKKVKLSDGQEITTSGLYTVNEEGLKSCSKGYKTFYSIWYFNDIPNFSYNSIGYFFHNSRYIYFYNIENINWNSSFSWVSNQNKLLEAVESNRQIATGVSNGTFRILQANCLRKIPDLIFRRNGNVHSPNTIQFSIAPYIKYKDMTKIINSRNFDFTSGVAPEIANSFLDETIDFENDWGMPTTLFTTTSSIIGPYAVQKMDFENVTSFKGTLNVSEVYEVYNIKISNNYFTGEMLSHDTLVRMLNALYNYSGSENTYTLTLGATNLAKLTNDEKAIATNKGWTLA